MPEPISRSSHDGASGDARRRVTRRVPKLPREPFRVVHLLRLAARLALQASLIGTVLAWPLALPSGAFTTSDPALGVLGRELVADLARLGSPDLDPLALKSGVFIILTVMAALAHLLVRLVDRGEGASIALADEA